jgi:AI-2 transport protein TqsA
MNVGRGFKALVLMAAVVVVLTGAHLAVPVLVPFLLAGFIAVVSLPLVGRLARAGVPRIVGVTVAIVLDIAALVAMGALVGVSLAGLERQLPLYQERLGGLMRGSTAWLAERGLTLPAQGLSDVVDPGALIGVAGMVLRSLAGLISNLVLVLVLVGFMLLEAAGMREKLRRILREAGEREAQEGLLRFARATREVQKYLVVKTATSAATGVLAGLWVWALGLDLPVVWGLLAFVLNYIPALGSIIAAIPPIAVALLLHGPGTALVVGSGYLVLNFTIGNLLEPRILGQALGLSPLAVLLSVLLWAWILGPAGALVAVPLTVAVKVLLSYTEDLRWLAVLLGPSRVEEPTLPSPPTS